MKYFLSDLHLYHTNVLKFGDRPFSSIEEMNTAIMYNINSVLKKGDDFYLLGDLAFRKEGYDLFFSEFPKYANLHWVLGNHDKQYKKYEKYCTSVSLLKEIKIGGVHTTLCHYPMISWNKSHHNSWMLFGHHHSNAHGWEGIHERTKGKMLNVNCEFHDFTPWSEDEIVAYMETKEDNWDYIKKVRTINEH